MPSAVWSELPCENVVGERDVEDLLQSVAQLGIGHRDDRLDATVEVARHEVGRSEVVLRSPAVAEGENARVLEELAHDRAHANPVREAGHARPQRAHRPDPEIDLRAVLRSRVASVDALLVDQVVDLDDDPAAYHS